MEILKTLGRREQWYRPYIIYVGNKTYRVHNILFYDESGVVAETSHGWLEDNSRDLDSVTLSLTEDFVLKRKTDFNITNGFIISKGKDYKDEIEVDLYIHKNIVNLHNTGYKKQFNSIYAEYKGTDSNNYGFNFFINVKYLGQEELELRSQFDEYVKKISGYDLTEEKLKEYCKNLKKIGTKLLQEKMKNENYSVEDYLQEIGE